MRRATRSRFAATAALAVLVAHYAGHAEELTPGAALSISCAGCHGTDGVSPGSIPSLQGKPAAYLARAMRDFRSGERPATVMGRHAKGYTDEEIRLMAEYFANRG